MLGYALLDDDSAWAILPGASLTMTGLRPYSQIRGRKFKRIYALLSSQVMMRPVTVARYTMMVVSLAIIAAQAIAFALIMVRVSEYRALSTYVQKAGAAIKARRMHESPLVAVAYQVPEHREWSAADSLRWSCWSALCRTSST